MEIGCDVWNVVIRIYEQVTSFTTPAVLCGSIARGPSGSVVSDPATRTPRLLFLVSYTLQCLLCL